MADQIKTNISGYGLVFKRVMKDTNISIEAKALYSYLSAYSGADESAFPSVDLIKHELNIGKHRFLRAKNELISSGYLNVSRKQSNNIYGSNLYTLFHNPRQADDRPVDDRPIDGRPVDSQPTTINSSTINNNTNNNQTINNSATDVTRDQFEQWWNLYGKKKGKDSCYPKFKKRVKEDSFEKVMEGTRLYLKTIKDKQFQKYPLTFLNQRTYKDDFSDELEPETDNPYANLF